MRGCTTKSGSEASSSSRPVQDEINTIRPTNGRRPSASCAGSPPRRSLMRNLQHNMLVQGSMNYLSCFYMGGINHQPIYKGIKLQERNFVFLHFFCRNDLTYNYGKHDDQQNSDFNICAYFFLFVFGGSAAVFFLESLEFRFSSLFLPYCGYIVTGHRHRHNFQN